MLPIHQILVTTAVLGAVTALSACGQKGSLALPETPAGVERPTLPQVLRSSLPGATPAASAASAARP